MRIVLDTNVIIAAFAARGLCKDVFEVCLSQHTLITSEHILSEVEEKLSKKLKMPANIASSITKYLMEHAEMVEPEKVPKGTCRDQNDLAVLGTALAAKADVLVTGDEDLLVLKNFSETKILSPRQFWQLLSK